MRNFVLIVARISVAVMIAATLLVAGVVAYARSQGLLVLGVQTGSMQPAIRPGDAVLVRLQTTGMKPGDIISYRSLKNPDVIITHRLLDIDQDTGLLTTKGDALKTADPQFSASRVAGVVTRTIPLAGYGFSFLRHPAGLALAVYLPSVCLVAWEIRRLMRYYAQQRYQLYYY